MYYYSSAIITLFTVIIATLFLGQHLLNWDRANNESIRSAAFLHGYATRERIEDQWHEGYADCREKYASKQDNNETNEDF